MSVINEEQIIESVVFEPESLMVKSETGETVLVPFKKEKQVKKSRFVSEDEVIVREWISHELCPYTQYAKSYLFTGLLKSLKTSGYKRVHPSTFFINYLSENARKHFRVVGECEAEDRHLILYDWSFQKDHFFILASNFDSTWQKKQMDKYESIERNNLVKDEVTGEFRISPKGYSILRRHAIKNLCTEFMKLQFIDNFRHAKTLMINQADGEFVTFLKKRVYDKEESV